LLQFTTSRFVNRKVVTQATRISTEDMKDILEKLAIFRPPDKWEFALPYDETIASKYPQVAQRQEMLFKAKLQQVQSQQGDFKTPKREPGDSPAAKQSRRIRRRSRQDSCSSDSGSENKK
jgi:RPC5 protein